jgi:hypothetical protein
LDQDEFTVCVIAYFKLAVKTAYQVTEDETLSKAFYEGMIRATEHVHVTNLQVRLCSWLGWNMFVSPKTYRNMMLRMVPSEVHSILQFYAPFIRASPDQNEMQEEEEEEEDEEDETPFLEPVIYPLVPIQ